MTSRAQAQIDGSIAKACSKNMPIDDTPRQRDLGFFLTLRVALIAAGYISYLLIARVTDVDTYGRFVFDTSVCLTLAAIASLGQSNTILRFASEHVAARNFKRFRHTLRVGFYVTVCGGLIQCLILIVLASWHTRPIWRGVPAIEIDAIGILSFVIAISDYGAAAMRTFSMSVQALFFRDIISRFVTAALVIFAVWRGFHLSTVSLLWITTAGFVIAIVLQFANIKQANTNLESGAVSPPNDSRAQKAWTAVTIGMTLLSLLGLVQQYADVIVIGALLKPSAVASYFNAARIANILTLPLMAICMVQGPLIGRLFYAGETQELAKQIAHSSRVAIILTGAGVIFVLIFGRELLWLFGPAYTSAYYLLALLAISGFINVLGGPCGLLLSITGQEKTLLMIQGTCFCAGLLALPVAVRLCGPAGAAIVQVLMQLAWNLWASTVCRRRLKIDTTGWLWRA